MKDDTRHDVIDPFAAETRPNGVVSARDRAALRRIRIKAIAWTLLFAALAAGAVAAYRTAAYPWFGWSALAALVVAGTYLVGWSRGARQLAAADDGDEIACRYTLEGPVFGSVEWWWSASPVIRRHDRGRLAIMGVLMAFVAAAFAALAVVTWLVLHMEPLFAVASALLVVPPLALCVVCFAFLAHPSARAVQWFVRARWGCWGYLVVAAGVLLFLGRDERNVAQIIAVFAVMGTLVSSGAIGLRSVAAASLERQGAFTPQRARIDADLRRMAAEDPQSALDDAAMSRVNRRRERRNLVRAALGVAAFLLIVAAESLARYRFHV
ncbi:hypothetical protein G1C96_0096 [Bifidobacterium sp. DSM 109958]|uniref:Transmembrane protein n=1 Tax=Bifidobacterium moraviense TaxID=2675323 RepID=A0A7Y0F010_9BIFI|nr:hypothetical protein [Bifidobacterium sp. DSM 109958]NMM99519.1 hypothetical protein [Bifidobacterium sp. DSM 109958]